MGLGHILMQMEKDDMLLNGVILSVCMRTGGQEERGGGGGPGVLAGLEH